MYCDSLSYIPFAVVNGSDESQVRTSQSANDVRKDLTFTSLVPESHKIKEVLRRLFIIFLKCMHFYSRTYFNLRFVYSLP